MAKTRNKNRNNKQAAPIVAVAPVAPSPEQTLAKIEKAALEHANEDDIKAMEVAPVPTPGATSNDLIKRAADLHALLESQRKRLAKDEEEAAKSSAKIASDRNELKKTDDELRERESNISERMEKLLKDEEDFIKRHEDIIRREADADAGFSRRSREALSKLEEEAGIIREQLGSHRKQIADERAAFEKEHAQALELANKSALEEIELQHGNLDHQRAELADKAKAYRKLARELDLDRELLDEDRKAFEEKVAQCAAREIELKEGNIRDLNERLNAARADRDEYAKRLTEREDADRRFGGETPDKVLERLRTLEDKNKKLSALLEARPSAEASDRLKLLETQRELWDSDRLKLLDEISKAREDAKRRLIAVTELEALRDAKQSLEFANKLLHKTNEDRRADFDKLTKREEGKSPFPTCTEMDLDFEHQSTIPTTDKISNLSDFAEYVRHRMVRDPNDPKKMLYYSAEDVRCFLGGLAMSRLHLLQGISGTGKTSLPRAFAHAIGAKSELVEIQAGWRDRHDLIGHFNTFENRFQEEKFLQFIYRASTPRYRDIPFIIVLDEMNLSHPEQYFASILSALEQSQSNQEIELMTAPIQSVPRQMKDNGKSISIPANVWFVGTANHDETTVDFAPKTYDRAHVMELAPDYEVFKQIEFPPLRAVSLNALTNAFDTAVETHRDAAVRAYGFLQRELGQALKKMKIVCGNRLDRQMRSYIPVVVASGGTIGEATDHIVATKLLRMIRGRHDYRIERLKELRDRMQSSWSTLDKNHEPRKSLAVIREELQRRSEDED